jgi:tetratricopeptide (TPR) repeat protein
MSERSSTGGNPESVRAACLAVLLVGMTLVAYGPALRAGYIWDDDDYVTDNPLLSEPDGMARIWFSMDAPSQYVPMVYSTLRFEYGIWGLDPFGYHLVNVLLHAANALLLWLLLSRIQAPAAWLIAAVFALHPVHVESVAWISERKNVLSLFFSLVSLIAWLRFIDPGQPVRRRLYGLSIGLYCLALLSKATACTLPAAMLLLPWMRGEPINRRRIVQVVPFLLLGTALGLLVMFWERFHIGTHGEQFELAPTEALLVATRACWFYLGKLIWPTQLTFSYPRFEIDPRNPMMYGWFVAGSLLLLALWLGRQRIGRAPLAAAVFFVATLSPVLGFIPLHTFWFTFVADHYQYQASIGPIALFTGGAAYRLKTWGLDSRVSATIAALVLGALGAATFDQTRIYENRETLWRDTASKNPSSWLAQMNLGRHLLANERWDDAIGAYHAALRIQPEIYRANLGLAKAMWGLGRHDEMLRYYEQALVVEPNLPEVRQLLAANAWKRDDIETAVRHLEAMVGLSHVEPGTYLRLGRGLERLDRPTEAQIQYERALAIDPELAEAQRGLARVRRRLQLLGEP